MGDVLVDEVIKQISCLALFSTKTSLFVLFCWLIKSLIISWLFTNLSLFCSTSAYFGWVVSTGQPGELRSAAQETAVELSVELRRTLLSAAVLGSWKETCMSLLWVQHAACEGASTKSQLVKLWAEQYRGGLGGALTQLCVLILSILCVCSSACMWRRTLRNQYGLKSFIIGEALLYYSLAHYTKEAATKDNLL